MADLSLAVYEALAGHAVWCQCWGRSVNHSSYGQYTLHLTLDDVVRFTERYASVAPLIAPYALIVGDQTYQRLQASDRGWIIDSYNGSIPASGELP